MTFGGLFQKFSSARGRVGRVLLIVGLALAATRVLPSVPREQILLFQLEGAGVVRRLDATWTASGSKEPVGGVSLNFSSSAPHSVRQALSLPNGPYELAISLERNTEASAPDTANVQFKRDPVAAEAPSRVRSDVRPSPLPTHFVRRVQLEGGETVIRL
jgi:hypothetical protein